MSSKLPPGYVQVTKETPLVPGTRLRIYQSFKWNDLSVLGVNKDGSIHVRFIGKPENWDNDFKRSSLVISQEDLDILKEGGPKEDADEDAPSEKGGGAEKGQGEKESITNPKGFGGGSTGGKEKKVGEKSFFGKESPAEEGSKTRPSKSEPEESEEKTQVKDSLIPISRDMEVAIGIPIRAKNNNKVYDATIIEILDEDRYRVKWDTFRIASTDVFRSDTLVLPKVLEVLKKPGGKELFASRAERAINNVQSHPYPQSEYGIRLPLPKNAVKVTEKTPLRSGAKVGLNNYDRLGRQDRWWDATVVELNWDDSVRIHIDGEFKHYDGDIDRACLIISEQELSRLENIAREEAEIAEQTNEEWENLVRVTDEMKLFRGTPVYADMDDGPQDATVLDFVGDQLHVVSDATGGNDTEPLSRGRVKIRVKVLEALKLPGTEEKLQRRADRIIAKVSDTPFPTTDFLPPPNMPRGYVRVGDETPLEVGRGLKLFSNGQWWNVEIKDLNWDGSVRIRVYAGRDQYDGDIERRCLVIDRSELATLEKSDRAEKSPFRGLGGSSGRGSKSGFGSKGSDSDKEMSRGPASQGADADDADSSTGKFKVVLKSFGKSKKIGLAQKLSDLSGQPYGDSLRMLSSPPVEVMTGVSKREAEEAVRKLRAAGGEAEAVEE
ncbi:MAG: ribosomal protein L7/L12 [Planctomycetaceae bacterium]|nr:ribosomal protein L7/L12 [Planctomycetaceae bacterium]